MPTRVTFGRVSDLAQKLPLFTKNTIGAIEVFNERMCKVSCLRTMARSSHPAMPTSKQSAAFPSFRPGICCGENLDYLRQVAAVARGAYDFTGWQCLCRARRRLSLCKLWVWRPAAAHSSSARALGGKPLWLTEIGAQLDWNWAAGRCLGRRRGELPHPCLYPHARPRPQRRRPGVLGSRGVSPARVGGWSTTPVIIALPGLCLRKRLPLARPSFRVGYHYKRHIYSHLYQLGRPAERLPLPVRNDTPAPLPTQGPDH